MKDQKAQEYAEEDWKNFANGVILSQKDAISSSKQAFVYGWNASTGEREKEIERFVEWVDSKCLVMNLGTHSPKSSIVSCKELFEKFRSLPPSPPKE